MSEPTLESFCEAQGGYIVSINDQAENNDIDGFAEYLRGGSFNGAYYWLGIHNENFSGAPGSYSYDWYDGTHVTQSTGAYQNWGTGFPNTNAGPNAVYHVGYNGWIIIVTSPTNYDGTGYSNICEMQ
jgi:hypothetical protein